MLGLFLLGSLPQAYAQTAAKRSADSLAAARARISDSTRTARAHTTDSLAKTRSHSADSLKVARKQKTDSVQAVRKKFTDSTTALRKYKESKKYKDSVTRARNGKTKAMAATRQAKTDSLQASRKHSTDSLSTARKERTDSIKAVQKTRTDSLAKIKKYKTSKRYADSVTLVRRERSDSIKSVQKGFRDSVAAVRKHSMDSTKVARTKTMDSTKAARTKFTDSLKTVRKARTDSLAKKKELKDKLARGKEKKKQEDLKLKLEIKMKQKREAWSNKSMLKKRWSPVRRLAQNSFTHYNYYYNANRKLEEAELNMQRSRKENYDSLIGLYPFNPNRDSSLLSADMDSIVRKVSVGIQIHDPRVKWSNDMYLILGQAYYYKGSYENASIAFRYIISTDEAAKKKQAGSGYSRSKEEPSIVDEDGGSGLFKHKSVHNDAILWLARTYTQAGQPENGESILSLVAYDPKFPDNLKGRLAIEKAFVALNTENYSAASEQLTIAADDNNLPEWLRLRAAFLNGQLQQNAGNYLAAAESFEQVLDHYPKLEMDFYARKNIAYNKLSAGQDVAEAMVPLKKMLNDGKYITYYDQVYFVLGMLAAKANKTNDAVTYLTKSTTSPKATKKQKAQSFAALGDVYYGTASYGNAKMAYDSAARYSSSSSKDKTVIAAVQRANGLKEISGPAGVIHDQDSLLALAALSKKEQLSVVRRYIRDQEKKLADSAAAAEALAASGGAPPPADEPDRPDVGSWYFANPALVSQGSSDFKRRWGTRQLKDNWRRAAGAGSSISADNNAVADNDEPAEDNRPAKSGQSTEESLLAKIPNTPPQKELAAKLEQRAYILLAKAYVKQLEDYTQAIHTLDTLDIRYPAHNQKEEELYLRYQIALKQNKIDKAQQYAQELLAKFPESQYANTVRPRKEEHKAVTEIGGKNVSQYFDETYAMIMGHQYTEALTRIDVAQKQFDHPVYKKRFEVAQAMAYAGAGDFNMADTTISRFIKANPADSLTTWAKDVQHYISEVRNGGKPSWYDNAVAASNKAAIAKKNEVKPAIPEGLKPPPPPPPLFKDIPSDYAFQADVEHYGMIVLPGLDSRTGVLKQNVRAFDSVKYAAANLDLVVDLYNMNQGVLLIRKFANAADGKKYLADLKASTALSGYKPEEIQLLIITTANYKKLYTDKKVLPYSSFYNAYYQ